MKLIRVCLALSISCAIATEAIAYDQGVADNNEGVRKLNAGDNSGAIEDFTKSLARKPGYSLALQNRAIAKKRMKNFAGALEDYNELARLYPDEFAWTLGRAQIYEELKNYKLAERELTQLIEKDSDSKARYLRDRARVRKKLGDTAGATKDSKEEKALEKEASR